MIHLFSPCLTGMGSTLTLCLLWLQTTGFLDNLTAWLLCPTQIVNLLNDARTNSLHLELILYVVTRLASLAGGDTGDAQQVLPTLHSAITTAAVTALADKQPADEPPVDLEAKLLEHYSNYWDLVRVSRVLYLSSSLHVGLSSRRTCC